MTAYRPRLRQFGLGACLALLSGLNWASQKPNILVIYGDDIGQSNISAYAHGIVGYQTPNIDRLASEGTMFTDYYGENSCTAGRSTFITGQSALRTGLTKVGVPGAAVGLQDRDITLAQALKGQGYATGQFGKNHLGDRDEYLPTRHGFDEFFGSLYHLNVEEAPEQDTWPRQADDPNLALLKKIYMPRGVIHSYADGRVEDTGALTRKRMETIDDETVGAAEGFIARQVKADKPFFVWMNTTRMHMHTHVRESHRGLSGMPGNTYADGMVEHDGDVGKLLRQLDELKVADNTIVIYTTDNGPNRWSWPDAATAPFRNEKNSNWEGAFRVPALIRWPGQIKAGRISNEIFAGLDWFPTLLAAAGVPDAKERLLKGWAPDNSGATFKVHLDGYNQLDYLTGKAAKGARNEFYYFNDDGQLVSMRQNDWKVVFCEQRKPGGFEVWREPFTCLRIPKLFNLRMDPYETADVSSNQYDDWSSNNAHMLALGLTKAAQFLQTFVEWPPSQRPTSYSMDDMQKALNGRIAEKMKQASAAP
ncbi:arylsulfatase [Pseudomonas sp. NPDC089996]|uniref:arylsulfatase n=1 Tax=Pseudomonas sp. NPDC089996 TaxID=3364474 RepID=UPI00382DB89E